MIQKLIKETQGLVKLVNEGFVEISAKKMKSCYRFFRVKATVTDRISVGYDVVY
jgi:hypothetical protein